MSTGITVKTARIEAAPKDAPTSLRSLTHADRLNRLEGSMQPIPALTDTDTRRFWSKVHKTSTCWIWNGTRDDKGYGTFHVTATGERRALRAHRVAYTLIVGIIPRRRVLDHICRVRECVNPDHLRPLTNRENVLIGIGPTAINARRTHCPNGHEYSADNTYVRSNGHRGCLACISERSAKRRALRRACPECGTEVMARHLARHRKNVHGLTGFKKGVAR